MIKQETWQSYLRAVREGSRAGSRSGFGSFAGSATGLAGLPPARAAHWKEDGWRQQTTAGAYECWHFEAFDASGGGVAVDIFDGMYFHPQYLRQSAVGYRSPRKRSGSAWQEASPALYPGAAISFFQGYRPVARAINLYPPGAARGEPGSAEFSVGPNHITLRQDGSFGLVALGYPMVAALAGPHYRTDQCLLVELTFQPTFTGVQHVQPLRPASPQGGHPTWVISAPHCQVSGRIQHLDSLRETVLLDMPLRCTGGHDHFYGKSPLTLEAGALSRGRAVGADWALTWHHAEGRRSAAASGSIGIFGPGAERIFVDQPRWFIRHSRRGDYWMRYPALLKLQGADAAGREAELLVRREGVLESSPWSVLSRCSIELRCGRGAPRWAAGATMETLDLRRLAWPILSDLALRCIYRVPADDPLWRQ